MEKRIILSRKNKRFLKYKSKVDILEGTTASGKTTVGAVKFLQNISKSKMAHHLLAGRDVGTVEQNIINADLGIKDVYGKLVEYYPHGHGKHSQPHILFHTKNGDKIIHVIGYNDVSKYKSILGSQMGCIFIDECNKSQMSFLTQALMRFNDYCLMTLNPDNPDLDIYKLVINRARPLEDMTDDVPAELLAELNEPEEPGWVWWYFSFNDNLGLSEEKIKIIKAANPPGTADYKHYVQGLRGKASGIIFENFGKDNICTKKYAKEILENKKKNKRTEEYFIRFSAGLDTSYSSKSDDTIAMSFVGITNLGKIFILDEQTYNNKNSKQILAPSDTVIKYIEFLEKNRKEWGFARDVYIDSADQATVSEFIKYKNKNGSVYNFNGSFKKIEIITRIQQQTQWISQGYFYVVEDCKEYQKELSVYSWDEKKENKPEDKNDHIINSVQYAFMAFLNEIGQNHK